MRRRRSTRVLVAAAAALTLLPATATAATDAATTYDHGETIVVGPSERPATAAAAAGEDQVVFNGRGSYHSVGMSQYGARGQALEGRSASEIMRAYYAGTSVRGRTVDFDIRVAVLRDTPRVRVLPRGGPMDLRFADRERLTVLGGAAHVVTVEDDGSCTTTGPDGPVHTGGCPTFDPTVRIEVQQPDGDGWARYGDYGSGAYDSEAVVDIMADQLASGGWRIDTIVQLPLEQYLLGLAEVPYSWEEAALRAQAIAGRSYALHRMLQRGPTPDAGCSCHVWDSQRDQVYRGHEREVSARWDDWRDAVTGTANLVVVAQPGQAGYDDTADGVVQAFYSASSHGRTENKHEVFFPSTWGYMVTVPDDWSLEAPGNPYASWSVAVDRATVAARVGLPSLDSVTVTDRRQSGSARTVEFRGGGQVAELSGDEVRWAFGLLSNGFGIGDEQWAGSPEPEPAPPPPSDLFVDDDDSVHEASIDWMANQAITTGCSATDQSLFCPERTVTREQMAVFLTRALDLPLSDVEFRDIGPSRFKDEIGALAAAEITFGCNPPDNDRFCPRTPLTRAQMASFLVRALDLAPGPTDRFQDVPPDSTHARDIGALAREGITLGCNPRSYTRFCPDDAITRAEMATFLFRALG